MTQNGHNDADASKIFVENVEQSYGRLLDALWRKGFQLADENLDGNGEMEKLASDEEFAAFRAKMDSIREKLNGVKAKVHAMVNSNTGKCEPEEQLGRWRSFTSFTHPFRQLPHRLVAKCAENGLQSRGLCTQAYCKFLQMAMAHPKLVEMSAEENEGEGDGEPPAKKLNSIGIRDGNGGRQKLCSLHLCEAPGAFVLALKHLLASKNIELDWRMNSLISPSNAQNSPSTSSNNFDQSLMQANPSRMALGPDGSGDIFHWDCEYSARLIEEQGGAKFHLVTADGGIDCTDEPQDQESRTHPLIRRQFQIATECLRLGGNFLLKAYTFFEAQSLELLATICAHFRQVHCVKPPSSKPGNSEVYLLCLNFRGQQSAEKCATILRNPKFLERVTKCAQFFAAHQIQFIQFNLCTFRRLSQSERTKLELQKCAALGVMADFLWEQIGRAMKMDEENGMEKTKN